MTRLVRFLSAAKAARFYGRTVFPAVVHLGKWVPYWTFALQMNLSYLCMCLYVCAYVCV